MADHRSMLPDVLYDTFGGAPAGAVDRLYAANPAPFDILTDGQTTAIPWARQAERSVGTSITVDDDDPTLIRFNRAGFYAFVANVGFNQNTDTPDPPVVYVFITTDTPSNRLPKFNVGVTLQDISLGDAQVAGAILVVDDPLDPDFGALVVGDWITFEVFQDMPGNSTGGIVEGGEGDFSEHTFINVWRVSD